MHFTTSLFTTFTNKSLVQLFNIRDNEIFTVVIITPETSNAVNLPVH